MEKNGAGVVLPREEKVIAAKKNLWMKEVSNLNRAMKMSLSVLGSRPKS